MAKQAVHRNPNSRWRVIRGPYTTRAVHAQASAGMAGVSLTRSNRTRRADDRAPGGRRCSQFRSVPLQVEFRQRLWAPLFVSVFFDAGSAAPRIGDLPLRDLHCGFGAGIGIFRANILAIGADFSSR
jgi:hypothetical protein